MFNNPRKILIGIAIVITVLGGITAWRALHPPLSDQEQIAANIEDLRAQIEKRNTNGALKYLAKDFRYGGIPKKDLRTAVAGTVMRWRDVKLNVSGVRIEVQGETATTVGRYSLSYRTGESAPTQIQSGDFRLQWQKLDGNWEITQADGPQSLPE